MATVDAAPLRIVVADDSPESRALLRAMLDSVDGVEVAVSYTHLTLPTKA